MSWERLRGVEMVSLSDWPGVVSAVLFFQGCNLRCPTCHNADLAFLSSPTSRPLNSDAVLSSLTMRGKWLDGVTVSGGEATTLPGLSEVLADIKSHTGGLPIKLDTNGMRPDVVEQVLEKGLVDVFAVDVKGPWAKYPTLSGGAVSPEGASARLGRIFEMAACHPEHFYFRMTAVPLLTKDDIVEARGYVPAGFDVSLQSFREPAHWAHQTSPADSGDVDAMPFLQSQISGVEHNAPAN